MKLEGDEEGIAALKAIHAKDKGALKFLITDAKTTTDMKTTFRAEDGRVFVLRVDPRTGNLVIEPKG